MTNFIALSSACEMNFDLATINGLKTTDKPKPFICSLSQPMPLSI